MARPSDIDLSDVKRLIGAALGEVRDLDGIVADEGNSARKAAVKRSLLFGADLLDRAAAEMRAVYHTVNGNPDPLKES